tara:strand:+ start:4669 stop:5025 length:357 start_codon:yes stop_codon:yes gene_type:complete
MPDMNGAWPKQQNNTVNLEGLLPDGEANMTEAEVLADLEKYEDVLKAWKADDPETMEKELNEIGETMNRDDGQCFCGNDHGSDNHMQWLQLMEDRQGSEVSATAEEPALQAIMDNLEF